MQENWNYKENHHSSPEQRPSLEEEQQYTYINGLGFLPETPQQKERKQLIMHYNVLLFGILLLFFLRVAAGKPVLYLLSILGFDVTVNPMTSLVIFSKAAAQTANLIVYCIYMLIPAIVIMLLLRRSVSVRSIFAVPNVGTTRYGVGITLGMSLVAQTFVVVMTRILQWGGLVVGRTEEVLPKEMTPFVLYMIGATIVHAILEEFLFHGVILGSLRRFGDALAISVSSILMMLVQPSADMMVYTFVLSLSLGYFALKSGSIVVPVIASFAVRGMNLFALMLQQNFPPEQSRIVLYAMYIVILLGSLVAFCRFVMKDKKAFDIYLGDTYLTNRTKIKFLFTNFGFWMVVVLAFFKILAYVQIIN